MILSDVVALTVMAIIAISLIVRIGGHPRRTYKPLLLSQALILVLFAMRLSWIYPTLDAALGNRNFVNLGSHVVFVAATWIYTQVVAAPITTEAATTPVLLKAWVPAVAMPGVVAFFFLDPEAMASPDMVAFADHPAWMGYWVCTLMGLAVPAFVIVPWLVGLIKTTTLKTLTCTYGALIIGYSASVAAVAAYITSYYLPAAIVLRELMVLATALGITVALIIIPLTTHQKAAEYRARQHARAEAVRRFQH